MTESKPKAWQYVVATPLILALCCLVPFVLYAGVSALGFMFSLKYGCPIVLVLILTLFLKDKN